MKDIRSFTKYPLSSFVSYKNIFSSYCAFISQVFNVVISNSVQETLNVHEWKEDILKETRASKNNANWNKVDLPDRKTIISYK